jgi:hypothetical protein
MRSVVYLAQPVSAPIAHGIGFAYGALRVI